MLFTEFNLKPAILKALDEMGYKEATEIQKKVMHFALAGKNIVGQSQTGTGKTSAFLLPILQKIDTNKKGLQVLILAPTRELVNQIAEEIFSLTKYYRVNAVCVYGGASPLMQKKLLLKGPSIVVATPGRLMDFMNQRVINVSTVTHFVLDEVDRMLDMGFVRDIKKIRSQMRNIDQTYTFSATISPEIKAIIDEHVRSYEFVKVGESITVDKINHTYVGVAHQDKMFNLVHLIEKHPRDKVLIFTQTKRNTKTILEVLQKAGFEVGMLNGDMSQSKRMSTLRSFKENVLRVLVTTDVAARGLNMDNVGLVINFDVPKDTESYIHRIGRTGRAGAFGKAVMLVSGEEQKFFSDIERTHKTRIQRSEHESVSDAQGKYTHLRLDRSTDKFGKGRMNPNKEGHSHKGARPSRTPRPSYSADKAPFRDYENKGTRQFSTRDEKPVKSHGGPFRGIGKSGYKPRDPNFSTGGMPARPPRRDDRGPRRDDRGPKSYSGNKPAFGRPQEHRGENNYVAKKLTFGSKPDQGDDRAPRRFSKPERPAKAYAPKGGRYGNSFPKPANPNFSTGGHPSRDDKKGPSHPKPGTYPRRAERDAHKGPRH